jgi:hypothetical protein
MDGAPDYFGADCEKATATAEADPCGMTNQIKNRQRQRKNRQQQQRNAGVLRCAQNDNVILLNYRSDLLDYRSDFIGR